MDPRDLRIGDAEREHTMAALREHFAQGRLDHAELDERLDRALAARTARDLAEVTADLPGHTQPARPAHPSHPSHHAHRDPVTPGPDDWRAAMKAHRHQMEAMRHAHRDMRRTWHRHPHGHHRHGPGPFVPILFVMLFVGLVAGGWGVAKVLFVIWVAAMAFSLLRRHLHHRG